MSAADRPEMTLRDYWRVVVRRRWIVIIGILATTIPATALAILQDPVYEAHADILIHSQPGSSLFGSSNQGSVNPDRVVQNEISVLEGDVVFARLKDTLRLTDDPPRVSGTASDTSDLVTVRVRSGDPDTAAELTNAYITAYIDTKRSQAVERLATEGNELQAKITEFQQQIDTVDGQIANTSGDTSALEAQRRVLLDQQGVFKQTLDQIQVDSALSAGNAEVVAPATAPLDPIEPNPKRTAMLAFVVGLLLGLGAAFLVDYLDDSVRTPDDIAKLGSNLPVIAVVPIDQPPDTRPISISKPDDFAVEAYRTLRTNVQFLGLERDVRVLQITSALPGEGKTTTATNLAVVIAQTGHSVVLVDADLRKPRVHRVFAIDGSFGLTDNLVGEGIDMTVQTINEHLSVIVSGRVPPNPSEMLSGRRMDAFIDELKKRFDYVIVDSAPTLAVSDAVALSRHVDGVLIVVQAGRASLPQVRQTIAALEQVGAPLLGVVLNKANPKRNGNDTYGDMYGYQYGDRAKPPLDQVGSRHHSV
jgi:polysaccharide biosynthesis transport protein